jgi:hypothetical protein
VQTASRTDALARPARAERIALVVGGEPGKAPHVIDAIAPWLTDRGHTPVLDALDDAATGRLVACFLDDDDACAAEVVRAAAGPATLDRLLFVMVDLEQVVAGAATVDNVTLTGLLFDPTGAERRAERRLCEDCRIAALATAATDLAAAALGATAGAADPAAVPVAISSSPAGATIAIDGTPAGTTPATVPLAPGRHRVRLALAGHIATERDLDVAADRTTDLDLTLTPLGAAARPSRLLPVSLLGAGAAMLVTGAILVAIDEDSPDSDGNHVRTYRDSATAGVVVGSAGIVAAGVGLWLLLRGDSDADRGPIVTASSSGATLGWHTTY